MSLEAAAGKNPVTHTGKLYNLIAQRVAQALVRDLPEVAEAYCYLLSRIGEPVTEPQLADVQLRLQEPRALQEVRTCAEEIVRRELSTAGTLWRKVIAGPVAVC